MSKSIFRNQLSEFKPYVQGKPIEQVQREYGLSRIEKLASNENQFGPSPKAMKAISAEIEKLHFYPEGHPFDLVAKLSEKLGVSPDMISVGNGGEGVLWTISMTFLNEGDEIIVPDPTFDVYKISATFMGGKIIKVPLKGQHFDIDGMLAQVNEKTKLVYLCTPNNPTGHIADESELDKLVSGLPEDVVLVLDEAYYEFACEKNDYPKNTIALIDKRPNTVILRTFSKVYGIAGVRMGYVITSPAIAANMNMVKQTFGVNRLAQAAALASLDDDEYMQMVVSSNEKALDTLREYFDKKGWTYFPSYTNFIWVDSGLDSKAIFNALQQKGAIIRPGHLWGWNTWLRISTGTQEQMAFLIEKLEEVVSSM